MRTAVAEQAEVSENPWRFANLVIFYLKAAMPAGRQARMHITQTHTANTLLSNPESLLS